MRHLTNALTLAAAFTLSCHAVDAEETASAEPDSETFALATATCGDVYDLFEDATPGEDKDPQDVAEAQDDVLYFVVWVHGFLSGQNGVDLEKRPLGQAGIEKVIAEIDQVCKPDESKRFLDVATTIE